MGDKATNPACIFCGRPSSLGGFDNGTRRYKCNLCKRFFVPTDASPVVRLSNAAKAFGLNIGGDVLDSWKDRMRLLGVLKKNIYHDVLRDLAKTKPLGLSGCRWYATPGGYTTWPFIVTRLCGRDEPIVIDIALSGVEWLATAGSLAWRPIVEARTGQTEARHAMHQAVRMVRLALAG